MASTLNNGQGIIFVGGAPRSGTTLMQRIMGAHSNVYAGPEFDFIPTHILKLRSVMLDSIKSGRIDSIIDERGLDAAFQTFICSMFEARLKQAQKSFFCEKTPANALAFPELEKILPDARHVMMLRDPRDIVNSMQAVREKFIAKGERPPRFVRSVAASVQEINRFYDAGLTAAERSDKILLVYYEDLVSNPSQEVRKVCDHVGLPYEPEMLNIEQKTFALPASGGENWYSQADLQQPIGAAGVVTKKKSLSRMDLSLVERFMIQKPALLRYKMKQGAPNLREIILWRASLARKACIFCPRRRAG